MFVSRASRTLRAITSVVNGVCATTLSSLAYVGAVFYLKYGNFDYDIITPSEMLIAGSEYRPTRHPDDLALLRALSTKGLMRTLEEHIGPNVGDDDWKAAAAGFLFEAHKPMLMLQHCENLEGVRLVDVAPTAAAFLGITFPASAGKSHMQQ